MFVKSFSEFLNESHNDLRDIAHEDPDMMLFINMLVHDKRHVIKNITRVPEMDTIFSVASENTTIPLYRGLHRTVEASAGESIIFDRYESFSESLDVAKTFTKVNTILKATNATGGFKYWKYMIQQLNDPLNDMVDEDINEELRRILLKEREWIFNIGSIFFVDSIYEQDGYKIIQGRIHS